jgi:hypothetical protein
VHKLFMQFDAHLTFLKIYFYQFGNSFSVFNQWAQNLFLQFTVVELNNSNITNYVFICKFTMRL